MGSLFSPCLSGFNCVCEFRSVGRTWLKTRSTRHTMFRLITFLTLSSFLVVTVIPPCTTGACWLSKKFDRSKYSRFCLTLLRYKLCRVNLPSNQLEKRKRSVLYLTRPCVIEGSRELGNQTISTGSSDRKNLSCRFWQYVFSC